MKKINSSDFRVSASKRVHLNKWPTLMKPVYKSKKQYNNLLQSQVEELSELQRRHYASDRYAVLVIFQAMDAAGKDSTIKHVMSGINPQGCQVTSFKQPSEEEMDHDFLWRSQIALPERGRIGIFNRSHYEEVLIVKVHPEILQTQRLPDAIKNDKDIWKKRYQQIRNWEETLAENGTHVLKFFLNVSREEQKKRFLERIDMPDKNWKFNVGDSKERARWDDYMRAYKDAMEATSTKNSPWFIIPADKKWFTRLAVSEIIVRKLESLKLHYPVVTEAHKADLFEAKKVLESEK